MELVALYKRVIGLDIHQAQITACALIEEADGSTRVEQRQFGGLKRDRRELADWVASLHPDEVVMKVPVSTGRVRMRRWKRLAFPRRWSMRGTSRTSRGARPMSATRTGWRPWPARACCAARLCRRRNCEYCV